MSNRPVIVAAGRTRFGEHYEKQPERLIEEAWLRASEEAGLERKDLEACYISDYFLLITNKLGLEEGFLSELTELHVPMDFTRSFSSAFSNACNAIQAGKYNLVLIGGIEKMTDRWDKIRDDLMLLGDPWSYYAGGTPEANHELMLRAYIKKYGIEGENLEKLNIALAQISVKNHLNALKNEFAQLHKKITVEQVLEARKSARRPLGVYDFAPISDGAAAVVLASEEIGRKLTDKPVYVLGSASATDYLTYPAREDLTAFLASRLAMENALKSAGINLWDIQVLEVYDQSTVMEMVSMEDLGFCERGKAWKTIFESCQDYRGYYEMNGRKLFVNMNGGLKADGNPLGATGGAQIYEVFKQLRGEAGERQVKSDKELKYGCVLELEGFGTKSHVHIFGREPK
ncbi:MAG: thiolase family protein [Nitrososphaerota archaeon]|nr:thiolase family protein [Candidatus Bathyarchaeota archaeon]MDW8022432.1 thiolase family protein [Nitrososphaerota archaeon]